MFDDERDLNNQNLNETENGQQEAGINEHPEYINSEDSSASNAWEEPTENQSDYNNQENSDSQNDYDNLNSNDSQNYYDNQNGNDSQNYYNNNGQDYYNNQNNQSYYGNQNYYDNQRNDYNSGNGSSNNNKKKGNKGIAMVSAVAAAAVVLVGGIVLVTNNIWNSANRAFDNASNPETTQSSEENAEYPTIGSTVSDHKDTNDDNITSVKITDVSGVVNDVMPSIVAITSTTIVQNNTYGNNWFYGGGFGYGNNDTQQYEEVGAGSGIIVKQTDTELLIVTNNHVVSGADSLSIQFVNGTSIEGVTKSTDESADIAIVSIPLKDIDNETLNSIKIATLGSSDDLNVGEGVVAIGNALGYGQSVTTGVISARDREIAVDDKTMVVLQTDAAINGGNSGGALLNARGEVIGINVAKYSSSSYSGSASIEGMGFAIPISQATDIINNLMSKQTRTKVDESERGALGIKGVTVTSTNSEIYSIPLGAFIKEITEGGAAEKAGLRVSDVITKFDGQSITTINSLVEKLEYYKAGETVPLTIERNVNGIYEEMEINITLGSAQTAENSTNANTRR